MMSWPYSPRTRTRPIGPWSPIPTASPPRRSLEGGASARSGRCPSRVWITGSPARLAASSTRWHGAIVERSSETSLPSISPKPPGSTKSRCMSMIRSAVELRIELQRVGFRLELHAHFGRPLLSRRHVGAPVAELGDVAVAALGQLARVEDALDLAAVGQAHRAAVEVRRLARLDPAPDLVRHEVDLARDRDAAVGHLEHAGVAVIDRVQAVDRRRPGRAQELRALKVAVQRQAAHQRAVDEELDRHGRHSAGAFCSSSSGAALVPAAGSSCQPTRKQIAAIMA